MCSASRPVPATTRPARSGPSTSTAPRSALGDTYAYEKTANPDGKFDYGFLKTPKSCLAQLPKNFPGSYSGVKETHPYATATNAGTTYVADAGANAIFAISPTGVFSTVAALKPVKVKVTRSAAETAKLPNCVIGKKFALEAVPTDIEYGPDGQLYVTSLPGGPEDGSLGLNGRVLKIDPTTGKVSTLVGGLLSPTGVAVASNGDVYVAQLFRGVISKIKAGGPRPGPTSSCRSRPPSRRLRPGCWRRSTRCPWARSPRERSSRSRRNRAILEDPRRRPEAAPGILAFCGPARTRSRVGS